MADRPVPGPAGGPRGAAVLCLLLLVVAAAPVEAQRRSYAIESFKVSLQVNMDGSLLVRESIAFAFRGSHQGVYRTIPIRYERHGFSHDLRIDDIHVLDERGDPLRTEITYPGRYLKIKAWVPGARDATRTVFIAYRVRRALLRLDDHDELYWNVTGTEWEAPIALAEALVALPAPVPLDAVRMLGFTGPFGAAGRDYAADRAGDLLVFRTTRALGMREGLTVVVGWPAGHVRHPSRLDELGWFVRDQRWFALPLLVLAGCILAWRRLGRDPGLERSVKVEYEPPEGLRPGEAGALVDETVHPRDVVATMVDLAVRGHLRIKAEEPRGLFGTGDYQLTLGRPWPGDPDITPVEALLLSQLFGAGIMRRTVMLSEVRRDTRVTVEAIRGRLYRDLVDKGFFLASPRSVRRLWGTAGGLLMVVPLMALLPAIMEPAFPVSASFLVALAASGLTILAFARVMPRKTLRGARMRLRVLGFQEFLERAEKDRLERLPPDTLHRWLPYAIALGVEEAWIASFAGLAVAEPAWLESGSPFSVSSYSSTVDSLGRDTQRAWLTAARGGGSSFGGGGSGFSGGSSGGGGGGGGGGTF